MESTSIKRPVLEQLEELWRHLATQSGFATALSTLEKGGNASFDRVWGSGCALLVAALANGRAKSGGPLLAVTSGPDRLDALVDDLRVFLGGERDRVAAFPAWENEDAQGRPLHDEIYARRMRLLKRLAWGRPPEVVATSIQSLLQPVPSAEQLRGNTRLLRVGDRIEPQELAAWLTASGFAHTPAVDLPGEFALRGGLLDIFAADWDFPARIEFFDNEIDSLRRFDPASQRSLEKLKEIDLTVLGDGEHQADRLVTELLPPTSWTLLFELEQLTAEGERFLARLDADDRAHDSTQVFAALRRFPLAFADSLSPGRDTAAAASLRLESVERFTGEFSRVREELDAAADGKRVFLLCQTEAEQTRLIEVFQSTRTQSEGRLEFTVGLLSEGFQLTAEQLVVLTSRELFARGESPRVPRGRPSKAIDNFLDLRAGDLVVHLAHGIGRFRGIKLLRKEGQAEEHLELEFRDGAKLYVPASQIDRVQKYVGGTKRRPPLAKLGGKLWSKQKEAAQQAVNELAGQLLEVHASRQTRPGIPFGPETAWQYEFDASFPYQETPDQLTAIEAIKGDMRAERPMDRLLCGDVGFGKTEMAMRAAFKAVDAGYQVAVMVPTTILAEQHFRTFHERMAAFPVGIGKLSRFCSPAEQRETLAGLAAGSIDIVIGTHRLASQDVVFRNLGLLVIDEEQRFGVEVKERLKTLRTTVDVLTLSATPIPRTLHMSLVGLRDISNLLTPPEARTAVETNVIRFDEQVIRHAVLRELNRGGQIYFVHNRVNDIELVAARLRNLVPEASLRIGHGQMPEGELEEVMVDFVGGRFDLLLATTIVESGLDIPNANTIFIDEAERYGLSDLHQLRGRVGRYKHRGYCYLLTDPRKHLNPNAARRLRAIEEFSELGAGFQIAMRDLEIRGAGNLLGSEQSGHIAAVGYELYCQLLEAAVRKLRSQPQRIMVDVDLDLPGEAYLPEDFVGDPRQKIEIYRRIGQAAGVDDLQALCLELEDRFGAIPKPAWRLFRQAEVRMDAAIWQIRGIHKEGKHIVFTFGDLGRMEQLVKRRGRALRIVDDRSAYLTLKDPDSSPDDILRAVQSVLRLS